MFKMQKDLSQVEHAFRARHAFNKGFTLIELMIVVAIIAIILTLALPVYSNYAIRAKVGEALSIGASALTSTGSTCIEDPRITGLTNAKAGYGFLPGPFVASVSIEGSCSQPRVIITTQRTGAIPDPILTLTGYLTDGGGQMTWSCVTNGPNIYVPKSCRS